MITGVPALRRLAEKASRPFRRHAAAAPQAVEAVLAPLEPRFRSALLSMYRGEPQLGSDGRLHPLDRSAMISPSQGMWLYDLCVTIQPRATAEIGMAYGYSTLFFLAAIASCRTGHHTAIDPFQHAQWDGIGLAHARSHAPVIDGESVFLLIEERSDRAATDLARADRRFEVIFIDGNHRFDDALVDFYLYAPLCAMGGYIIFDDIWMSSIRTVVAFVRENRGDFVEVRTTEPNICAFRRVGDDTRDWKHFRRFGVSRSTT